MKRSLLGAICAALLILGYHSAEALEPCEAPSGAWHDFRSVPDGAMWGVEEGTTSAHIVVGACVDYPDGGTRCPLTTTGNKHERSWIKYSQQCPEDYTATECSRALVAPPTIEECVTTGEGGCSAFYPGMLERLGSCLWAVYVGHPRVVEYAGAIRVARDGWTARGPLLLYSQGGQRVHGAPPSSMSWTRH